MFKIVPYERAHLEAFLDQKENLGVRDMFSSGKAEGAEKNGFTLLVNNVPACCGGVFSYWEGRGQIWTVFNTDFKENFVPVFRGIKAFLSEQLKIYRRIEVSIPIGFEIGRRRVELLGFNLECDLAKQYLPDGSDAALYALVRQSCQ